MAKKKNKGFSLIEVVIAVAVLGLLITPILTQIVQTSNTSRRAKERQAAVENAEYITNFIQRTDKSELDKASSGGVSDISITKMDSYSGTNAVLCKLVNTDGDEIKTVKYTATVYTLDNTKLGPKSNEYKRKAMLDDLNNVILAEGYSVVYDKSKYTDSLKSKGYQLTNEGSIVKHYSTDEEYSGLVKEIVCEARPTEFTSEEEDNPYKYKNPNAVSLGFIQDLDSTKVAIIQGIASNFDAQVVEEIFSQKMGALQTIMDDDEWYNQLAKTTSLFSNDPSSSRLLYISITAHKNAGKIEYYEVTCDACYFDATKVSNEDNTKSKDITIKLKYNVFAKKFYTSESPDIYLIYEPFVSDRQYTNYAYNDFIQIYNDEESKDSKLYLIKPSQNQLSLVETSKKYVEGDIYATEQDGQKPVNININTVLKKTENLSSKNIIKTFTNIDISYKVGDWEQFSLNDEKFGGYLTDTSTLKNMALSSDYKYDSYPEDHLKKLDQDTNVVDRLYTITVLLEPVDGKMDDVRYSSGKGVN